MPYSPPSTIEWNQFLEADLGDQLIAQLDQENNIYRKNQIQFIQVFSQLKDEKERNMALTGACIHVYEEINREWKYWYLMSSRKDQSYVNRLLGTGSDIATLLITKGLNIHPKNPLSHHAKLIYLEKLLALVNKHFPDQKKWLEDIQTSIQYVLTESYNDIEELLKQKPTSVSLIEEFKNIKTKYDAEMKKSQSWSQYLGFTKQNILRPIQVKFIELLGQEAELNPELIYGCLFYFMKEIGGGNSILYKLCQETVNLTDIESIHPDLLHDYYGKLNTYVNTKITENKWDFFVNNENSKITELQTIKFFKSMRAKLDDFNLEISHEQKSSSPSYFTDMLNMLTTYFTAYGIRRVAVPAVTSLCSAFVMPEVVTTLTLLKPELALLGGLLLTFANEKAISSAAGNIATTTNYFVIYFAKQPFIFTYQSLDKLKELGNWLKGQTHVFADLNREERQQWCESLLLVNDTMFSPQKKAIVRRVMEKGSSVPQAEMKLKS